ncbi:hypothetical protein H4R99_002919 [Coemansia sp. RSA 1722]|nr:hypothetical protein LPJ57_001063 [Coemansia sp. RSA 486]KAJ2599974.1 hypothetical protein GGF39_001992 [Coemansia sp. RSA 1721]KAJ2601726.1 hypothetical protein H4R99_002919 [Coemansia sp. RSA 1722]
MCASPIHYEGEFHEAKTKRPLSVIFFYDGRDMSHSTFLSQSDPLSRYAITRGINNLHYFRTDQLANILPAYFSLYLPQGILVFRDGNLLDYMEDFNYKDFEKTINAPSTQSCLPVPINSDTKLIKQTIREERAKGISVKKVLMSKDRTKLMIYHDDSNITIRPIHRGVDACVGTDSGPVRAGVDAGVGTDSGLGRNEGHSTTTTINNNYRSGGGCCMQ